MGHPPDPGIRLIAPAAIVRPGGGGAGFLRDEMRAAAAVARRPGRAGARESFYRNV